MKKLLFNGCSFVSGAFVVWDQFCIEHLGYIKPYDIAMTNSSEKELIAASTYNSTYRRQYNLPKQTADLLSAEVVDLSEDGNSNDNIALSTIAFLLDKSPEERGQYHVCIGWTELTRLLKYNTYNDQFINLTIHYFNHTHPIIDGLQDYIKYALVQSTDSDFAVNYVRNIMLLENFLIANNVTYTFFRSLGTIEDCDPAFEFYTGHTVTPTDISKSKVTNHLNWFSFAKSQFPYSGPSWYHLINSGIKRDWALSPTDQHPNLKAINEISHQLADFIRPLLT